MAKLQDRSIASHAGEFFRRRKSAWDDDDSNKKKLVQVEPICRAFLQFMRGKYLSHYGESRLPEQLRSGPEFLVGGIGRDDAFPSLYRVSVQSNTMECDFSGGDCGISWNGQADAIERFIRGFDGSVRAHVEQVLEEHGRKTHAYTTDVVNGILDQLGQKLPEGTKIDRKPPDGGESSHELLLPLLENIVRQHMPGNSCSRSDAVDGRSASP